MKGIVNQKYVFDLILSTLSPVCSVNDLWLRIVMSLGYLNIKSNKIMALYKVRLREETWFNCQEIINS